MWIQNNAASGASRKVFGCTPNYDSFGYIRLVANEVNFFSNEFVWGEQDVSLGAIVPPPLDGYVTV